VAADTDAFQQLSDAELATLGQLGVRRAVAAGEYLYRESDPGYDFYVVLSGAVEIVVNSEGKERVIARHGAGRFLGELNLLTGQRVFVSARVAEAGEVIAVPRDALRRLIATDASLSDKILAAFLARRAILMSGAASAIRVIGSVRWRRAPRFCADGGRIAGRESLFERLVDRIDRGHGQSPSPRDPARTPCKLASREASGFRDACALPRSTPK